MPKVYKASRYPVQVKNVSGGKCLDIAKIETNEATAEDLRRPLRIEQKRVAINLSSNSVSHPANRATRRTLHADLRGGSVIAEEGRGYAAAEECLVEP